MSNAYLNWAWQRVAESHDWSKSRAFILVYICDQANKVGETYAGKAKIARHTRSDLKTVYIETKGLIAEGLLERVRRGKSWLYQVLAPVNGVDHTSGVAPDVRSGVAPDEISTTSGVAPDKRARPARKHRASDPTHRVPRPMRSGATPANPSSTQESTPKTREAAARNDAAAAAAPDGRSGDDAAPLVPPKAPALGTTTAGVPANALRPPGATTDDFRNWLDRGAPACLTAAAPDTLTEDDTPRTEADRAHMAAQLADLAASLAGNYQNNYPPRAASMSADDQISTVVERPRDRAFHLAGDQLAAARAQLRARVPA